jgi:hypothetical protein
MKRGRGAASEDNSIDTLTSFHKLYYRYVSILDVKFHGRWLIDEQTTTTPTQLYVYPEALS